MTKEQILKTLLKAQQDLNTVILNVMTNSDANVAENVDTIIHDVDSVCDTLDDIIALKAL